MRVHLTTYLTHRLDACPQQAQWLAHMRRVRHRKTDKIYPPRVGWVGQPS